MKPKILYFLQRGHGLGSNKFGVAENAEGQGGLLSMEKFAESIGYNLADSEVNQRVIIDWANSKVTIQAQQIVDISWFMQDLSNVVPAVNIMSLQYPSHNNGLLVCKYD